MDREAMELQVPCAVPYLEAVFRVRTGRKNRRMTQLLRCRASTCMPIFWAYNLASAMIRECVPLKWTPFFRVHVLPSDQSFQEYPASAVGCMYMMLSLCKSQSSVA